MFTGIIEEMGTLVRMEAGSAQSRLEVKAQQVLEEVKLGDSIAVNGVCLTVVQFDNSGFCADVMDETLKKSNLGSLKPGARVNLERALRLSDRLGGHLVQGHVDGQGVIRRVEPVGIARLYYISAGPEVMRYVVAKGSVAVDGISLTVVERDDNGFSVSLIPHSAAHTTLGFKQSGDSVNLESDIVGRYVEQLLQNVPAAGTSRISADFLAENGFL